MFSHKLAEVTIRLVQDKMMMWHTGKDKQYRSGFANTRQGITCFLAEVMVKVGARTSITIW